MITDVYQGLLSCIFITMPEFMFMVIVTLSLMGRKEMLDIYNIKNNLISIIKIVAPASILLDTFNYIIKTPQGTNKILSFIIIYIFLIIVLNDKDHSYIEYPKLKRKALQCFGKSILIAIAIESVTYPIILKLMDKTYDEIKIHIYQVIICSLASRVIDVMILGYILVKKNNKFQVNITDYVFNNKFFTRATTATTIGLVIFEVYFIKLVMHNNLLHITTNIYEQLFIVVSVTFLIPGLLIAMVYAFINCCIMINSQNQTFRND